jgi:hypothetical protein
VLENSLVTEGFPSDIYNPLGAESQPRGEKAQIFPPKSGKLAVKSCGFVLMVGSNFAPLTYILHGYTHANRTANAPPTPRLPLFASVRKRVKKGW